jgi:hypothetical protein
MAAFCDGHWRHIGSIGMKELMVAVERVVRPMRADPRRKMKMRQELLAHLTSAYEEAKARLGNESLALEEAVRRFGNPTDLTRDLQASVPFYERVLFIRVPGTKWMSRYDRALERYLEGKQGDPPLRRMARWAWLWFLSFFGLMAGPALIIYQSRRDAASAFMAAYWLAVTGGFLAVSLICTATACRALSGPLRLTAVLRASVFAFLAVGAPAVASAAILHWGVDLPIDYVSTAAGTVIGFLLILGLSFAVRFQAAVKRSREEWTSLEISD